MSDSFNSATDLIIMLLQRSGPAPDVSAARQHKSWPGDRAMPNLLLTNAHLMASVGWHCLNLGVKLLGSNLPETKELSPIESGIAAI